MRALWNRLEGPDHSDTYITDVYDEKRRVLLVQYPAWLIVALSLTGVLAFAITGFLGYVGKGGRGDALLDTPFKDPAALYFWFCALLITLQISILRNPRLRGRLVAALIVSLVCIFIIYFTKFPFDFLRELLNQIVNVLARGAATYTIINFAIIAVFWADTVRRWIRRAQNYSPNRRVDLKTGESSDDLQPNDPGLSELIAGDLIAGSVLTIAMAAFFTPNVISIFVKGQPIDYCTLALPGNCTHPGGGAGNPLTLSFIDQLQSLFYLPLGLLTLALTALVTAILRLNPGNSTLATQLPASVRRNDPTAKSSQAVVETIITTLRSAIDRQLRGLARNVTLSLRNIGWPLLILFGTYGISELSRNIELYLHNPKDLGNTYLHQLPAIGWGLIAVFGVVFSAALLVFRWRVAENSLRFLGLIGFVALLTFWIFSLALWSINQLLLLLATAGDSRLRPGLLAHPWWHPFDLGASTIASLSSLIIAGSIWWFRRLRSRNGEVSSSLPAAVGVTTASAMPAGRPDDSITQPVPPRQPEQ